MKRNLSSGTKNIDFEPSEGEMFIAEFFNEEKIKFQQEVPIVNLRNDTKKHRRADFYLPKYKVYVEFYGRWNNSKDDRLRYREKKKVFYENNIPCVYLYPENLGIIEFSFKKRLIYVLKKHKLKKELLRYRFINFIYDFDNNLFFFFAALSSLLFLNWDFQEDIFYIYLIIAVVIFQFFKLTKGIITNFK